MADPTEILTRVEGARRLEFWEQHPPDVGLVYLVQGERRAPVKVGHAKNVRRRVRELQTGNHALLHVLDVVPGGKAVEATLHQQLAEHRLVGEWFKVERGADRLAHLPHFGRADGGRLHGDQQGAGHRGLRGMANPSAVRPDRRREVQLLVRDRYRRQWISANPECNQMRHLGF